jgi:hypothetical protein
LICDVIKAALGQYYYWNRYAAGFFGAFIAKTNRYAPVFLFQGRFAHKIFI